jgi:hypothetical protein
MVIFAREVAPTSPTSKVMGIGIRDAWYRGTSVEQDRDAYCCNTEVADERVKRTVENGWLSGGVGGGCVPWLDSAHIALDGPHAHGIESAVGVALACVAFYLADGFRFKGLNRTLPQIHTDVRSGRQPVHTPAQRVCAALALVLAWYFML